MIHENDMSHWEVIHCQRGCPSHHARKILVDLAAPHGYGDLPQIPSGLARAFEMHIWDTEAHPVDGGPYCPAHDAVSETLVSHRIWEPRETCLTLDVLSRTTPGRRFADLGAQLGWFTLLAASCGVQVDAYDAEVENLGLLMRSVTDNGWHVDTHLTRIRPTTVPLAPARYRLVKIDLEGAEEDALRILWPSIGLGRVEHMMIEVSPVFSDGYPDLLAMLVTEGFELYTLPDKARPPRAFTTAEEYLADQRLDTRPDWQDWIAAQHQLDIWCKHTDASW